MSQSLPLGSSFKCFLCIFNFEIIRAFTSNFLATCSTTSYPLGFLSRRKWNTLDIVKLIVTTLRNQDNKVAFIRVDEDGALERYSESMRTYHNMNIIVQTTGRYEYLLNDKSEIPNKTLDSTTRAILLKSIHKNNYDTWPISMPFGYPTKLRIGCVVMFLNSSIMDQEHHTNTSKYGV